MSFWAEKINGTPSSPPLVVPSRDLFNLYTPQLSQPTAVSQQQDYIPTVKTIEGSTCPDCGSNYYRSFGNYAIACGECGYHPRFEQSGHGTRSLPTDPGVATPARQPKGGQTMKQSIAALNAGLGEHIK
jgi:hypothetical protein